MMGKVRLVSLSGRDFRLPRQQFGRCSRYRLLPQSCRYPTGLRLTCRAIALVSTPRAGQVLEARGHPLLVRLLHDGVFMRRVLPDAVEPCVPFRRYLRAIEVPLKALDISSLTSGRERASVAQPHLRIVYAALSPAVRCPWQSFVISVADVILPDSAADDGVVVAEEAGQKSLRCDPSPMQCEAIRAP